MTINRAISRLNFKTPLILFLICDIVKIHKTLGLTILIRDCFTCMHRFLSLALHVQVVIYVSRSNTNDKAIQIVIQHYVLACLDWTEITR